MTTIWTTFENSPRIRTAYQRYAAEQARYEYVIANWSSFTPGVALAPGISSSERDGDSATRRYTQKAQVFLDRNFLNTSRVRLSGDMLREDIDPEDYTMHPSLRGSLRYPLGASRESLVRTSEQIQYENRVNDTQMGYIKEVRAQLRYAVVVFFEALELRLRAEMQRQMLRDLEGLANRINASIAAKAKADLDRLQAEITSVGTRIRDTQSRYEIQVEQLKSITGLPFETEVYPLDEPFDPFGQIDREELLRLSTQSDPEIATLGNAVKSAEIQLDLARKGRIDIALLAGGGMDMAGTGRWTGRQEWSADAGVELRLVDPRISKSLEREAQSTISRLENSIQSRRNEIRVGTMEPLLLAQTLRRNIQDTRGNIERYSRDYQAGRRLYFGGKMDIDDLLRRRQNLFNEQQSLIASRTNLGQRMADLASATGKFFELLEQYAVSTRPASTAPTSPAEALPKPTQVEATTSQPAGAVSMAESQE
jgi:hypothetical protein